MTGLEGGGVEGTESGRGGGQLSTKPMFAQLNEEDDRGGDDAGDRGAGEVAGAALF